MSRSPDRVLEKAVRDIDRDLEVLWSEAGAEALDGLYSMYEGSEDVTCLSAKKLMGRRDKRYGRQNLFTSR